MPGKHSYWMNINISLLNYPHLSTYNAIEQGIFIFCDRSEELTYALAGCKAHTVQILTVKCGLTLPEVLA